MTLSLKEVSRSGSTLTLGVFVDPKATVATEGRGPATIGSVAASAMRHASRMERAPAA